MRMPILCGHPCLFVPVSYDRRVWASLFTLCVRRGMGGSRISKNQMKRFYQILAALALVVSMQGCSQDSELDPESKIQLHLTGSINQTTRVNANGFEPNDPIGIYITKGDKLAEADAYEVKNEAFTYQDGDILAPGWMEVCWDINSTKLNVYAYYPYINNVESSDAVEFAVNSDQSTEEGFYDSDFLYANAEELAPQTTPVKLTFDHLLSRVNVYINFFDGFTKEDVKNIESVKIKGLVTDGEIDLADGTVTAGDTKSTITLNLEDSHHRSFSAIVFPQEGAMVVEVVVNDKVYSSTVNVDFESNYKYTYNFTIKSNPAALILGTTSINGWSNGGYTMYDDMTAFGDKFNDFLQTAEQYVYDEESATWVSSGEKIDANGDGTISEEEALAVKGIDIPKGVVDDLTGIERFVNLESLSCGQPENGIIDNANGSVPDITLTKLDVSKNTKLKRLIVNCNRLRELDVTALTDLEILCCYANQLTGIDVSKNTKLKKLDLGWNEMTSVDISKNTALERISLWDCPISTILGLNDVTNLKAFVISYSNLTSLDLSGNTTLDAVECSYNEKLAEFKVSGITNLTTLRCDGNDKLSTLELSDLPNLTTLRCDGNVKLSTLELSDLPNLTTLSCWDNIQLRTLELSNLPNLTTLSCVYNYCITSLNLAKLTKLEVLRCAMNNLTSLDLSNSTALQILDCGNNELSSITLPETESLIDIDCSNNKLTELDVTKYTGLKFLDCGENQLVALDVSKNTGLVDLRCGGNQLVALDVSKNTGLKSLECGENQLVALDVSKNTELEDLRCGGNLLTTLDISRNTKLKRLECYRNLIEELDLSNNNSLEMFAWGVMNTLKKIYLPLNDPDFIDKFFDYDYSSEGIELVTKQNN